MSDNDSMAKILGNKKFTSIIKKNQNSFNIF